MTAEAAGDVWSRARLRDWTWADLRDISDDGHRYEIVDGSLYVSPGPSRPHQIAAGRVVRLLADAAPDQVATVVAGTAAVVEVPFRVELRPAELAGPRRRV